MYRCYFWSGCYWVWTMDWRSLFLVIHLLWRDKNSWFKTYHHYSCHYYKRVYHLVGTYNFKRIWTPRLRKLAFILFFSPIAYQRCGGEKANWATRVVAIMLVILPDLQLNPLLLFSIIYWRIIHMKKCWNFLNVISKPCNQYSYQATGHSQNFRSPSRVIYGITLYISSTNISLLYVCKIHMYLCSSSLIILTAVLCSTIWRYHEGITISILVVGRWRVVNFFY